jgi:hypothetical protein
MSIRPVVFGALVIIALVIAYEIGRNRQPALVAPSTFTNQTVTVSSVSSSTCKPDNYHKKLSKTHDRVIWASTDNPYCVNFIKLAQIPTNPPNYIPKSPLKGGATTVCFDKDHPSQPYNVVKDTPIGPQYYYYEIWDNNHDVCRQAPVENDTGLEVDD